MQESVTIQKHAALNESSNYEFLRQKGLEYIQQLGSRLWTDYNIHDPGITILELLSYAMTDLGYRTSLDIKDLLSYKPNEIPDYNSQAFYTAREILTTNPWTVRDYRKLLIDMEGVKNAWLLCKKCPCDDLYLYANCKKSELSYTESEHPVVIKGFYDVMVELDDQEGIGDLNSGKVKYSFSFNKDARIITAVIEMRLPSWKQVHTKEDLVPRFMDEANYQLFSRFLNPEMVIVDIVASHISRSKEIVEDIPDVELASRLRKPVYIDVLTIKFKADSGSIEETLVLKNVSLSIWFKSDQDRQALTGVQLKSFIADKSVNGIIARYVQKIGMADTIILKGKKENDEIIAAPARQVLHRHRNLCEDFCSIKAIEVEDIGVCADIEVETDADIEAVLAEAYYLIDEYMSPEIRFYSLQQLLNENQPVDEIFDGPKLTDGFIKNDQLDSTNLKKTLYVSDIINLLMDIKGVRAINNFVLTRYDDDGVLTESESWVMNVTTGHQPRLYIEASRFLVFKNGLPFLPDKLELADTLQVIKGQYAQPKFSVLENDLPVPKGIWFDLKNYYPLQYSLPLTYGVGYEGLPSNSSAQRQAQAMQLKAYLLFFEQMLVNYLEQLAHLKDLFSTDETVSSTYFSRWINSGEIKDIDEVYDGLTTDELRKLDETPEIFTDRRNRFLDHLLARFGEQFNDYALMLYSFSENRKLAGDTLIRNKIRFLKDYPLMSYNKARAFNYKDPDRVCNNANVAGLAIRIRRLLGISDFTDNFELYEERDIDGVSFERRWRLIDDSRKIYLSSSTRYTDPDLSQAELKAWTEINEVKKFITDPSRYEIKKVKKWVLNLLDESGEVIATRKQHFIKKTDAEAARDEIIEFANKNLAGKKILIVEHLLLRPHNRPKELNDDHPGDALLTICIPDNCDLCGEEDPYSFRLTIILNGEDENDFGNLVFRRFAEQTIRAEVPAHLGVKICWVKKTQLEEFEQKYCAWLKELSKEEPDELQLSTLLKDVLDLFGKLKNVYPPATLHDCVDGNDENRTFLDQTII
jgi:hypothetical protein